MNELQKTYDQMLLHQLLVPAEKVNIQIPNASSILRDYMNFFLSKEPQRKELVWLPQHEEIAKWLENNEGRGLLLYGSCGTGKTFITRHVLTAIILKYMNKVISPFDMNDINKDPDRVLSKHLLSIDDIGTEEISVKFGEKRLMVPEILDAAEKHGHLLLMTTNLNGEELVKKYGNRTMDRIIATTRRIEFSGKSFRE